MEKQPNSFCGLDGTFFAIYIAIILVCHMASLYHNLLHTSSLGEHLIHHLIYMDMKPNDCTGCWLGCSYIYIQVLIDSLEVLS